MLVVLVQRLVRSRRMQVVGVCALVAGMLAMLFTSVLGATGLTPQTQGFRVRHGHEMAMPGAIPPIMRHARLLGHQDGATPLRLSISLRLADPAGFQQLLASQQDPKSAQYHKYLSPQAFTSRFAPPSASVNAVSAFLRQNGLRVTSVASDGLLVDASGSIAQVEQTFHMTIGRYQLGKKVVYAPEQDPMLPEALVPIIQGISGLDDVGQWRPLLTPRASLASPAPKAAPSPGATPHVINTSPVGGYAPSAIRAAYDVQPLIDNSFGGTTGIDLFELAPYMTNDLNVFDNQYGIGGRCFAGSLDHSVDGAAVEGDSFGTAEAELDIELVQSVAPNACVNVWTGPNTTQGVLDTYNAMISFRAQFGTGFISTSWGKCEQLSSQSELTALHNLFDMGKAAGLSIFAASGDSGSDDCGFGQYGFLMPPSVDSPAGDPDVVAAGGTTLTLTNGAYGTESAWNGGCGFPCAGGGGLSSQFVLPSYQAGSGVANNPYYTGQREVPDVALNADPRTGYSIYCTSRYDCVANGPSGLDVLGWAVFGGTSAAAPIWAGIIGVADHYKVCGNSLCSGSLIPHIGWVNPFLYQLFANAQTYAPYHDVTVGNNDADYAGTSFAGEFPTGACYDMVTGVGSPDAWNLARDIAAGVQTAGGGSCVAPASTTQQLIGDGGFENVVSGWQSFSAGGYNLIATVNPHNGAKSFFACGYPSCDDRVMQTVTVPATVKSATLSFWVNGYSSLAYWVAANPPCVDHFIVTFAKPDGTVIDTVQSTCTMIALGYTIESFNVTQALQQVAGQQVVVMFRGTTANEAGAPGAFTYWFVDDVSLAVTTS